LGLVDGSRELLGGQDVGEVDEGAGAGGDPDPVVDGALDPAGAVDTDLLEPMLGRPDSPTIGDPRTVQTGRE
jgi:hypothetical protein